MILLVSILRFLYFVLHASASQGRRKAEGGGEFKPFEGECFASILGKIMGGRQMPFGTPSSDGPELVNVHDVHT